MSGTERSDSKSAPAGDIARGFSAGIDAMVKSYEPALRSAGRWNLELVGLASRRARAWLEIPQRLGHCKSPTDIVSEQLRFWQTAMADYSEASHRMAAAIGAGASAIVPGLNGAQPRDYITFAEPKEAVPEAKSRERKAA